MDLTSDPRFNKYVSVSVKGYEFQEEITSKLNELWNLLEYIIYFKYFDEIYENGFSRSPKVLFSEKSDMSHLKLQLNKHHFFQNKNTNSKIYGYDYYDANRHLFEICKKLIVGPDWYFKDFFLDDINAIKNLLPLVNDNKYYQLNNKDEAFYQKYQRLGYVNEKAKYWHHGEEPHKLFADELINFNEEYKCLKR